MNGSTEMQIKMDIFLMYSSKSIKFTCNQLISILK